MNEHIRGITYSGDYYRDVGEFLGEAYLNYGFAKGTKQEVDFLVECLGLPSGSRLLDVGCGPGRHSLELARRGFRPVGVDITPAFIRYAEKAAEDEGLSAAFAVADARRLTYTEEFDAAICLCEGAFGLAGSLDHHRQVLRGVNRALKPGALFVLTAIQSLSAARNTTDAAMFDPYDCVSSQPGTLTNAKGETKETVLYTTCFTFRELKWLLEEAGFEVLAGYGCVAGRFSRKPLELDDTEIMMVGKRK